MIKVKFSIDDIKALWPLFYFSLSLPTSIHIDKFYLVVQMNCNEMWKTCVVPILNWVGSFWTCMGKNIVESSDNNFPKYSEIKDCWQKSLMKEH